MCTYCIGHYKQFGDNLKYIENIHRPCTHVYKGLQHSQPVVPTGECEPMHCAYIPRHAYTNFSELHMDLALPLMTLSGH